MQLRLKPERTRHSLRGWVILTAGIVLLVALFAGVDYTQNKRVIKQYQALLTADVQNLTVDGIRLSYRVMGQFLDEQQSSALCTEPILLIHGFLGSSYDFSRVMPDLAKDRPVIAVDLAGFGLSDKSPDLDYSKKHMSELLLRFMDLLGYEHYAIMGHSMGGEIALRMALAEPGRITRLILISSGGGADIQRGFRSAVPEWLLEHVFKNYLVQRLYFPLAVGSLSAASTATFDPFFYFNKQIPAATLNRMTLSNDSGLIAGRLGEIQQPSLLVWGKDDRVIPLSQGNLLDERIPDSRLVVFDHCGHLVALERPAELIAEVHAFLVED